MVQIKLSIAFVLAAAAIAPVVAQPIREGREFTGYVDQAGPVHSKPEIVALKYGARGFDNVEFDLRELQVKAEKKNIISKSYGGDISRKKKLLKNQEEKRRVKQNGEVEDEK